MNSAACARRCARRWNLRASPFMNSSGGTSITKTGSDTPSSTSASIRSKRDGKTESGETRKKGDKETRGQGDKEKGGQGDISLKILLSPHPLVPLSPCLPLFAVSPPLYYFPARPVKINPKASRRCGPASIAEIQKWKVTDQFPPTPRERR